ncbi:hypothetical protein HME9302_02547 [Alteripontixanthobacter maritimus]|uniref:Serine aminopeptidase S33 domain-containing protein n=1 Tax=Alteripontixanthobacter maritimus TaxID=2161824 RepID=A0A369QDM9_9SPHN|nr:alpha/beta fold hydrolase [Alteripontixanthobacter maritimus]RDC58874.1 hypothetical protein HME9302_00049 [Alteripontixanthobacter maritimus]RDC61326.1 hypothetical protein HME9302_02547 [Alteripontixanthobacter maritimus]
MDITKAAIATIALMSSSVLMAHDARPITAAGPDGELAGTLLAPAEGKPLVLIIPGSGPTDRDGNSPLGISASTYRMLAEDLAARGIGSLRIDKRGMFGSAAAVKDANAVTIDDYVQDIAAWIAAARMETSAECIWLAGHSEGGLVALSAAGEVDNLCGLILIAAPGRPLGMIMREQFTANPMNAPILPDAMAAIDALEAGERVDVSAMHPALQGVFAPQVQGFLIDLFARDPAALIADTDLPVLIVQGEADIQVASADAKALSTAQPVARFASLPGVNHVLKDVGNADRAQNMASYANPELPIAPTVTVAIADFVLDQQE